MSSILPFSVILFLGFFILNDARIPLKSPHRYSHNHRFDSAPTHPYNYTTKWTPVDYPVDHFAYTNTDKFKIKYLVNDAYYKPGGPIFFYAGNEGPIKSFADNTGIMWDLAPHFNAMLLFAEHRYYGETMPYPNNASYSNVNKLGYLTSGQALADYAQFLPWFRKENKIPDTSKIIVFGGSYGGMLSIWFRLKYPTLTAGAWASSAPVLYFNGGNIPTGGFDSVVKSTFISSGCDDNVVKAAFTAVTNLGSTQTGRDKLNKIFNMDPATLLNNETDVASLKTYIQIGMEYMAMTDYPYPTSFLQAMPGWPVSVACSKFSKVTATSKDEDLAGALRDAANVYYNSAGDPKQTVCLDSSKCSDQQMGALSEGPDGWDFQECTEIIIKMCSLGEPNDFFDMSCNDTSFMDFQKHLCNGTYGGSVGWTPDFMNVDGVKNLYGWDFSQASNIIFTNGNFDPWHVGGVNDKTAGIADGQSRGIYSFFIEGSAHHLDLRQPMSCDPDSVVNARFQIVQIMNCWLNPDDANCPYTPTPLPGFTQTDSTNCKQVTNGYPWGQKIPAQPTPGVSTDQSTSGSAPGSGSTNDPSSDSSTHSSVDSTTSSSVMTSISAILTSLLIAFNLSKSSLF